MFICLFCTGMCLLEGRGWRHTQSELKVKFWPTYKVQEVYTNTVVAVCVIFFTLSPSYRLTGNSGQQLR